MKSTEIAESLANSSLLKVSKIQVVWYFTYFMNSGDLAMTFSNSAKDKKPLSSRSASSNS